ncbi:MAG: DnaD domain protein [Bradymonadia bacterium]
MLDRAYIHAIERAFLEQSGKGLMLSARDLEMIQRWARAGLPAEVVIQGIERAFDHRKKTKSIRGLESVLKSVDAVAQAWRARQVGSRPTPQAGTPVVPPSTPLTPPARDPRPRPEIAPHQPLAAEQAELTRAFDLLLSQVERARADLHEDRLIALVDLLLGRLTQLRDDALIGKIEDPVTALESLEEKASEAFWDRLDADTQEMLSAKVDDMLAAERKVANQTNWQATRDRQRLRQVRRHLGLPDLQLRLAPPSW